MGSPGGKTREEAATVKILIKADFSLMVVGEGQKMHHRGGDTTTVEGTPLPWKGHHHRGRDTTTITRCSVLVDQTKGG